MENLLNKIRFDGDKIIWRIIIFLSLFSILAIFSSSSRLASMDSYRHSTYWYFIHRHLIFLVAGFVLMYICHRIPISVYKNFATLSLVVSIGLLGYMLILGETLNDGTRWIAIAGIRFQPIEVAKISVVLYLANILENNTFDDFKSVVRKIIIPIGTVCILTFIAGTSMGLLLGIICISILFIGGLRIKNLLKICGLAIAALIILFTLGLTFHWPPRVVTAVNRIESFFGNDDNEKAVKESSNTQSDYAKMAVASGGLIGKGPGNSTQRHLLPHPYSDFVFAIIIEEYGLIIGALVLLAYMSLLYRAAIIAKKCTRIFSSVTVLGLMLMIVFQAMLNMGVSVGVFPVTGQTLPFISLGGTSILCTGIALGTILSVSRAANNQEISQQESNEKENEKHKVSDTKEKTIEYDDKQ
ncbi:MAG: FtsW/RodA/SpoVE family cell cycle protein [Prevotellaceae bacterium]|jgi:cell division protein FtsW|nr:FtsW/RodA/SpoVE family cell cycle protein [Prevotellaceae bacterium]